MPYRSAQWTDSFLWVTKASLTQMNVRGGWASNRSSGLFQLIALVSLFLRYLIAVCIFSVVTGTATDPPGFVEGHLKIVSAKEVELADGNAPAITAENYAGFYSDVLTVQGLYFYKVCEAGTTNCSNEVRVRFLP